MNPVLGLTDVRMRSSSLSLIHKPNMFYINTIQIVPQLTPDLNYQQPYATYSLHHLVLKGPNYNHNSIELIQTLCSE